MARRPLYLRALEDLGEGLRALAGPLLTPLVRGLVRPLQELDDLLAPTPDGDSNGPGHVIPAVFDLERTSHPELHAQLAGIDVHTAVGLGPNPTTEQVRDYVRSRGPARRGTPEAIRAAARAVLTGSRTVILHERDGSPWRCTVVTYVGETPDPAAVRAAIETERPLGIVFTYETAAGVTWEQLAREPEAQRITWSDAATFEQLGLLVPNEQEG